MIGSLFISRYSTTYSDYLNVVVENGVVLRKYFRLYTISNTRKVLKNLPIRPTI